MPWTKETAKQHNKNATGKKAEQWVATANEVLKRTGDDAQAIRAANAAIKTKKGKSK